MIFGLRSQLPLLKVVSAEPAAPRRVASSKRVKWACSGYIPSTTAATHSGLHCASTAPAGKSARRAVPPLAGVKPAAAPGSVQPARHPSPMEPQTRGTGYRPQAGRAPVWYSVAQSTRCANSSKFSENSRCERSCRWMGTPRPVRIRRLRGRRAQGVTLCYYHERKQGRLELRTSFHMDGS